MADLTALLPTQQAVGMYTTSNRAAASAVSNRKTSDPAEPTGRPRGPSPQKWNAKPEAKIFLRRIYTRPKDHQLVDMESRRRNFPEGLRRVVSLRAANTRDSLDKQSTRINPS